MKAFFSHLVVLAASFSFILSQNSKAADPLDTWTLRNPGPTPNNLRAVTFGNGLGVAVGTVGTIVTSADSGDSWTARDSGITNLNINLVGVAYGSGRFVAAPEPGILQTLVTSTNGTNWVLTPVAFSNDWFFTAIAYGGSSFVLVGYSGATNVILTSPDGLSWTRRFCGVGDAFTAITYAQNQFVAVGGTQFPTNRSFIVTSPDGITWTTRRTNVADYYKSVAGNANGFVAVALHTTSRSPTGTAWTDVTDANPGSRTAVGASPSLFVSADVSYFGVAESATIYTSLDGAAWTATGAALGINSITYGNGRFLAVGSSLDPGVFAIGTRPAIMVSADGTNWVSRTRNVSTFGGVKSAPVTGVAFGAGRFVALTVNTIGQGNAFHSANGSDWSGSPYASMLTVPPGAVTFGAGRFVAVGGHDATGDNAIASSPTGTNWTQHYTGSSGALKAVTFGGSQFVAVGQANAGFRPVLTSGDGVNWSVTTALAQLTNNLLGIAYGAGNFVAVGAAGAVARSADGSSWTQQSITRSNHLRGVLFTNSQFVAVGDAGSIFTSPDGNTWTRRTSGTTRDLVAIAYFSNQYLAVGDFGTLLVSSNATTWSSLDAGTDLNLVSGAVGGNQLVLGGESVLVTSTTNLHDWKPRFLGSGATEPIFRKVLAVDDRIVAFNAGSQTRSTTGRDWVAMPANFNTAGNNAYYTNGVLITVGTEEIANQTRISYSTNRGEAWTDLSFGSVGQLYGLEYGKGLFVTCGDRPGGTNAPIFTSTNGINWTYRNSGMPAALWDLAFGNNTFVAVGSSGSVRSSDGINWVTNAGAFGETVAFGGGKFVAAGGSSILLSTNGTNWSTVLTGVNIENVRYGYGTFIAVGPEGSILTSTNGSNWVSRFVRTRQKLNAVEFAHDSAFIVGFAGTIYQSDFLASTPATIQRQPQSRTVLAGSVATLDVGVAGRLPMTYQWFKNGVPLAGATEPILTLTGVTNSDAGNYHVVVQNALGPATSASATLTVIDPGVAVLPAELYLFTGTTGAFTASVVGATPLSYQWKGNFSTINHATNSSLVFTNAQSDSNGNYSVVVTFAQGSRTSTNEGQLIVLASVEDVQLYADPSYVQAPIGSSVTVTSIVQGPLPTTYQWRRNGTNLPGATAAVLTLTNVQPSTSGDYGLKLTYPQGAVTNDVMTTVDVYYAEPPVITGVTASSPSLMQITFTGLVGRYYEISYAANLNPPVDWQSYTAVQVTANPMVVPIEVPLFNNPTNTNAFFRIKILPP